MPNHLNSRPEETPLIIYIEKCNGRNFPIDFQKNYHVHMLCKRGAVTFRLDERTLSCKRDEFVFWFANNKEVTDISFSKNFLAAVLLVENHFLTDNVPDQNWGIDASLHSRRHPVKKMDDIGDRQRVLLNFQRLYERFQDQSHRFYQEALRLQMRIFILEMWHTFANEYERRIRTVESGSLYERFIHMVEAQCAREREVQFYASQLNITPKYLNHICKQNSGITASEWIQRFTRDRIITLLQNKELNIAQITNEMEFSSPSFFTRYVKKVLGVTPSKYRDRLR